MIKHYLLFADNISDLTLARYYAANDVDFLCFDLDQHPTEKNIEFIGGIREWIQGPLLIGWSARPELMQEMIKNKLIDFVYDKNKFFKNDDGINDAIFSELFNELEFKPKIFHSKKILKVDKPDQVSVIPGLSAFLINAKPEEITGIYDFDALDDIFNAILLLDEQ